MSARWWWVGAGVGCVGASETYTHTHAHRYPCIHSHTFLPLISGEKKIVKKRKVKRHSEMFGAASRVFGKEEIAMMIVRWPPTVHQHSSHLITC